MVFDPPAGFRDILSYFHTARFGESRLTKRLSDFYGGTDIQAGLIYVIPPSVPSVVLGPYLVSTLQHHLHGFVDGGRDGHRGDKNDGRPYCVSRIFSQAILSSI